MRVLFGHQSVGADLLMGLHELDGSAPSLKITAPESLPREDSDALTIASVRVGRNGDPRSKWTNVAALLDEGLAARADLVLLKLCYVDITESCKVDEIFDQYVQAIAAMESRHAGVTIGHVTAPLRAKPRGVVPLVRALMGHDHPEHERNRARAFFNERMRARYAAQRPVFDLAHAESRDAGDRDVFWRERGISVPALAPEYTSDGGHLNPLGRRAVARAFLDFLMQNSSHAKQ